MYEVMSPFSEEIFSWLGLARTEHLIEIVPATRISDMHVTYRTFDFIGKTINE